MPETDPALTRSHFALPEDRFLFYFGFDFRSFVARKNPEAAIAAFQAAFPPGDDGVGLVIKTLGGADKPDALAALNARVATDPRIVLRDQEYAGAEHATLVQRCDCYVSLHRSEGFGRGPAEAMLLGKPVIATAYSGNMDFMTAENSLLVDYRLMPVRPGEYPGWEGQEWADPDIEQAARHMQAVRSEPALAAAARRGGGARHRRALRPGGDRPRLSRPAARAAGGAPVPAEASRSRPPRGGGAPHGPELSARPAAPISACSGTRWPTTQRQHSGSARLADIAPVQDQPVMRAEQELGRDAAHQPVLHCARIGPGREAGAVADAEDMRVHGERRLAEGDVEHDIRRLAPDAGQRLERVAIGGHRAAMALEQQARQRGHVRRLGPPQPERADVLPDALGAEPRHRRGVGGGGEQRGGRAVHPRIGRLRGEHDRDEQRERVGEGELAARARGWPGRAPP